MIPYSEWLDAAKALPEGVRKRINHTCGGGRTMLINHDGIGFSCHCFRCNDGNSVRHGDRPISKLFQQRKEHEYEAQTCVSLPDDAIAIRSCTDYRAVTWLGLAGITGRQIEQYGIVYSPEMRRIILPVYEDGRLVFTQARRIHGVGGCKYLSPSVDRSRILFESIPDLGHQRVVLTEDILSAIRVGEHCKAMSLLGTSITTAQAARLLPYERVSIWLDGDSAGIKGAIKVRKMLAGMVPVDTIQTTEDPKHYTNREIKEFL